MRPHPSRFVPALIAAWIIVPSASAAPPPLRAAASVRPSPAGPASGEPWLAVDAEGRVWLSWIERRGGEGALGHAFLCSVLAGDRWSVPKTIAVGDSFFVNWADVPTLLPLDGQHLVAHWPWKRGGENPYAYDVVVSRSSDGGATWSPGSRPHRDQTATEHGFVSMVGEEQRARLVWLDGRNFADAPAEGHDPHGMEAEMTLRSAALDSAGRWVDEALIDGRVCDCCPTAAVRTARGVLVAYRDRSAEEVRDVSLVRFENGRWSEPYPLHEDGWTIPGCPVNGPALAAAGRRVVGAWYTGAGDRARVRVAFSGDAGEHFGSPVDVDEGAPVGRTAVVVLDDGSALVAWVEEQYRGAAIRVRHVEVDGTAHRPWTVARTRAARASGFPRMVRSADRLVFAWTETGAYTQVRTAVARLQPQGVRGR